MDGNSGSTTRLVVVRYQRRLAEAETRIDHGRSFPGARHTVQRLWAAFFAGETTGDVGTQHGRQSVDAAGGAADGCGDRRVGLAGIRD